MELNTYGQNAKAAAGSLIKLDRMQKDECLFKCASALINNTKRIIDANSTDMENARNNGMPSSLLDRLYLDDKRIEAMADGLVELTKLNDPIGEVIASFDRPNGLHIEQVRVPMGVIGIIYEARPNVTADAFGLCFKSGNAVILKGGSDALYSCRTITEVLREAITECGIPADVLQYIDSTEREVTVQFMKMKEYLNLLIPRGGAGLIKAAVDNAEVPVIETGTGNCHIFVDETADLDMAVNIIFNAKTQRIGVCNACESLLVHENIKEALLPRLAKKLQEKSVEMRCDEESIGLVEGGVPATEEDWGKEYLDYIISIKTVSGVDEAIAHINKYNTGHSEAIITRNTENAEKFLNEVDAACVYVNASTRFTDGFEFGFGAEIGISTQKLHARGPMGLNALTSTKYVIRGNGQVRG